MTMRTLRPGWFLTLVSSLAALATSAAVAPPAGAQDAEAVDATPFLGTEWYGVYFQGKKAGFAKATLEKGTHEGQSTVESRFEMTARLAAGGQRIEMKMTQGLAYAAEVPQRLLRFSMSQQQGPMVVERTGVRSGDSLVVKTVTGGRAGPEQTVPLPKESLRDEISDMLLVASAPAVGTKREATDFDLEDLTENTDVTEVLAVEETIADGVPAKVYTVRLTDGKTGDRVEAKALGNGRLLQLTFGGILEVRLEPEALAKNIEYSGDLFTSGLARPDKPLGEPGRVKTLVLRLRGAEGVEIVPDGRQIVTREKDGATVVAVRRGPPRESLVKATPEELSEARKPTLEHPSDHPEIREAAAKAVGSAKTDAEKAAALVRFVSDYVVDAMSLTEITALDVLHAKKGDCSEHTALFVALAPAAGLAARPVSGWMYGGDQLRAFGGHAWAEVVLDGRWVAVDPTWTQTEVDATHVRLGVRDQAEAMLRLHGKVKIEVVSVERD